MSETLVIRLEEYLPHAPARVWRALTEPELIARWLMPNDFRLEVGHRFTFQGTPIPAVRFDGTVDCEVHGFSVERMLRYSWSGQGENSLRSTVTWRLEAEGPGTRLFMEHEGFDPENPLHQLSHRMMSGGWVGVLRRLEAVIASTVPVPSTSP